jgi:hypothetical protein
MFSGGPMMPTLTWKVWIAESAWGATSRNPAGGLHPRIVGEGNLDQRIARPRSDQLLGHIEDGVASAFTGALHDRLPGTDDFAGSAPTPVTAPVALACKTVTERLTRTSPT